MCRMPPAAENVSYDPAVLFDLIQTSSRCSADDAWLKCDDRRDGRQVPGGLILFVRLDMSALGLGCVKTPLRVGRAQD